MDAMSMDTIGDMNAICDMDAMDTVDAMDAVSQKGMLKYSKFL